VIWGVTFLVFLSLVLGGLAARDLLLAGLIIAGVIAAIVIIKRLLV
jgi:hypothetical protein